MGVFTAGDYGIPVKSAAMVEERDDARPVQLHVIHNFGGGSAAWLGDFARADRERRNLVLRSVSLSDAMGDGLALYASIGDEDPIASWRIEPAIAAANVEHDGYRRVLETVISQYRVGSIVVSSLIGHSLDALRTGLPTAVVCHDFFPLIPEINLPAEGSPHPPAKRDPFVGFDAEARERLREAFISAISSDCVIIAPSRAARAHVLRLAPGLDEGSIHVIPHGYGRRIGRPALRGFPPGHRMTILVLGQLSEAKGIELLAAALPELVKFADVHFLGAGEAGERFRYEPHVTVIGSFEHEQLAGHVEAIQPHVGVLASVVEETFGYVLTELWMLGVPPVASRAGAFIERIEHGRNGFLFPPTAESLVAQLRELDADRAAVERVRAEIAHGSPRSAEDMVAEYHAVLPVGRSSAASTPVPAGPPELPTLVDMWKQVRQLHLQMTVYNEARHRAEVRRAEDVAAASRHVHELEARLAESESIRAQQERLAHERQQELDRVGGLLHSRNMQLAELYASTSWRWSAPVRVAGRFARRLRLLAGALAALGSDPGALRERAKSVYAGWRAGGMPGLKHALLAIRNAQDQRGVWQQRDAEFARHVRPRIMEAIPALARQPRLSLLVPTYNTPEAMLRATLDSVLSQLYPEWELCLADDGSSQPHVARILEEYARRDARIKLHLGKQNRGVSHASNRALEMATGECVVLLDHDDVLEPHALFRVAQAVLEDDPDLVYSDEVLTTADGALVREAVHRPAFSPERLRGHPYIVHIVAFRASLIRDIGGFDEALRISQDYDLILRASEKARRVVHIPDTLYRWRIHGGSLGHQKMAEVMDASCEILRRHLQRCGETGRVDPGAGFNFFDIRYPLSAGLRVAIVIPTKDHVQLLRQCIESIRATVREVPYEIVVVDHQSKDPQTRAYLDGLGPGCRVVPFEGPFNFSAINNRAVSAIGGGFTHVLLCNNDIEALRPGWLERMLELGQQPSVGIVGAKLLYPDRKTIQHAGVCVGAYGRAEHYAKFLRLPDTGLSLGHLGSLLINHEVAAVTAACLLIRKEVLDAVGGLDEELQVGFNDVDLCLRVGEKGYRVLFCPHAELVHHESMSRGTSSADPHPRDTARFLEKWRMLLEVGDPYFNPAFSLTSTTWLPRSPIPVVFEIRRRIVERLEGGMEKVTWSGSGVGHPSTAASNPPVATRPIDP